MQDVKFNRKKLAVVTAACGLICISGHSLSQQVQTEELIVTGIRAAQQNVVDLKRSSSSIVDAISAEDIGKLPDVTITDSLQRLPGVQINRTAGEGGALNVRGFAQVLTTLNGESYLGANSLTSVQPNFSDVPSQLFSGVTLVKSQTATQQPGGISGVVNLKTYRPFSFSEGATFSGAVQAATGKASSDTDPSINGLFNWRNNFLGVMLSATHSKANLANYYSGQAGGGQTAGWTGFPGEDWGWDWAEPGNTLIGGIQDGGADVNRDGDLDDSLWAYQGHVAYNSFNERERNGLNFALEAQFAEGFTFVAEALYTEMDDRSRRMGFSHSDKWSRWGWFSPEVSSAKKATANDRDLSTVQVYKGNGRRFKTYSAVQAELSDSTNINLELNYDNDGDFSGQIRYVGGEGRQERLNSYMDIDVADGSQWSTKMRYYPNENGAAQSLATNPNGYQGYPVLSVDYRGESPSWSGFDANANLDIQGQSIDGAPVKSLAAYLSDVNSYGLGALTSENNFTKDADFDVLRADGNFEFSGDFFNSIDFGIRHSSRKVNNNEFDLLSPIGPNKCGVKWKATDVVLDSDSCNWGDQQDPETYFTAGQPTPLSELSPVQVSDFGGVKGVPALWTVDPASMDNVESFHKQLYPGTYRSNNPGRSYGVELNELSYFTQLNFSTGIMSGNFGVRAVSTEWRVTQNEVGAANPYGAAASSSGQIKTTNSQYELLPTFNMSFDVANDTVLRTAVTKTSSPLDLNQWGGALSPSYALDSNAGSPTEGQFIIVSANADGNPNLQPWSATNFDVSIEHYLGAASMLSAAWFYIDVKSFVASGTIAMDLPDQDGVVRRTTDVSTSVQGEGGVLEGLELSAKLAMSDYLDSGFWQGFGADINYTYSPSSSGIKSINGDELPFPDNSESTFNLVAWYQGASLQARLAYNYRSERVVAYNQTWGEGTLWQKPTAYIDASISYEFIDDMDVFLNIANLSAETEDYYLEYSDQFAWQYEFDTRYTLGVRVKF